MRCPICGKKEGHVFFYRNIESEERGSMWTWCSACHHSAHALYKLPEWWKNLDKIDIEKLTSHPNYLDKYKNSIDEWVNKLLF